jgi:hypothetical protein
MKLEQQIHAFIVNVVGGKQQDVKGLSQTSLSKMKKGTAGITVKTLKSLLIENGIQGAIVLQTENQITTIKIL